jgi:histone chaperone ASF1
LSFFDFFHIFLSLNSFQTQLIQDLMEVTVILLTCSYLEQEFIRIGYYVNNDYGDNQALLENPPENPSIPHLCRNVLSVSPRVTRFAIKWTAEELRAAREAAALAAQQPTDSAAPLDVPATGERDMVEDDMDDDAMDDSDEGDEEEDEEDDNDNSEVDLEDESDPDL